MNEKLLILGMMLATFSVRYVMFGASSRIKLSPALLNALRYVPPVVLSAIVAPEVLLSDGALSVGLMNARLVGAIAAIIISYTTRNLLLTIVVGMVVFFAWQGLMIL
ncbi:MAG: AzlD domain-containing protein [Phormidesmis sp.]